MPVLRQTAARRRRSSHAIFTPAKAGIYTIPPRPISFAPNVTPVSFVESDSDSPSTPEPSSPSSSAAPRLFPPSETPAPPPARKRCPPGKRRSQGYIPRPPNAFMLFRADFVRQKHVPGSIETNHGSLSKIIGNCWRSLPLSEKRIWEQRAKHEKAAHKIQYPDYRFRPVHNKNKNKPGALNSNSNSNSNSTSTGNRGNSHSTASSKGNAASNGQGGGNGNGGGVGANGKPMQSLEDEIRCEEVTQLLLEGKKGEELARALHALEHERALRGAALFHGRSGTHTPVGDYDDDALDMGLGLGLGLHLDGGEDGDEAPPSYTLSSINSHSNLSSGYLHGFAQPIPHHAHSQQQQQHGYHRRSSSVPLPNDFYPSHMQYGGIALPSIPSLGAFLSRPPSPSPLGVASIARFSTQQAQQQHQLHLHHHQQQQQYAHPQHQEQNFANPDTAMYMPTDASSTSVHHLSHQQRMFLGQRRSSSAGAAFGSLGLGLAYGMGMGMGAQQQHQQQRSWTMPVHYSVPENNNTFNGMMLQRDDSPLPEVDMSLFEPSFLSNSASGSTPNAGAGGETGSPSPSSGEHEHKESGGNGNGNGQDGQQLGPLDTLGLDMMGMSPYDIISPSTTNSNSGSAGNGGWGFTAHSFHHQPQQQQQHQQQQGEAIPPHQIHPHQQQQQALSTPALSSSSSVASTEPSHSHAGSPATGHVAMPMPQHAIALPAGAEGLQAHGQLQAQGQVQQGYEGMYLAEQQACDAAGDVYGAGYAEYGMGMGMSMGMEGMGMGGMGMEGFEGDGYEFGGYAMGELMVGE